MCARPRRGLAHGPAMIRMAFFGWMPSQRRNESGLQRSVSLPHEPQPRINPLKPMFCVSKDLVGDVLARSGIENDLEGNAASRRFGHERVHAARITDAGDPSL